MKEGTPIARVVTGRRSKYLVLCGALLLLIGLATQAPKLGKATNGGSTADLPAASESARFNRAIADVGSSAVLPAVVALAADAPLQPATRARVVALRGRIAELRIPNTLPPGPVVFSPDRKAALFAVPVRDIGNGDPTTNAVKALRHEVATTSGFVAKVTGPAAIRADIAGVFAGADVKLLLGSGVIVLLLLVLIYRSPVFWLLPFLTVLIAEGAAEGLGYLLTRLGMDVGPATAGIMSVLVFGAGTDYALLLVARYREELRHENDTHRAMRRALDRGAPAIIASAATVCICLLVLLAADLPSTRALGPLTALGVAAALLATLTVLPTLLLVVGRRAFWPFVPRPGADADPATRGFWRRLGELGTARPRITWVALGLAFLALATGILRLPTTLAPAQQFTTSVESLDGQRLLAAHFPAGESAATRVFLAGADRPRAESVARQVASRTTLVAPSTSVSVVSGGAVLDLPLQVDPYSAKAVGAVPELRRVVRAVAGEDALVGGETAEAYDTRETALRDDLVIVPLALAAVFLILAFVLRALVLPLLLVVTVVLSFAAALGAGAYLFPSFGLHGADPTLPLMAFVFLIALGVDYNIFLMTRVREEKALFGTREATLRGLAVTGNVITSAGVVLAGTFSILALLPVVPLRQLGFVIGFGVLVDTLVVRSIIVPALAFDLGDSIWWPSRRRGHGHLAAPAHPASSTRSR